MLPTILVLIKVLLLNSKIEWRNWVLIFLWNKCQYLHLASSYYIRQGESKSFLWKQELFGDDGIFNFLYVYYL